MSAPAPVARQTEHFKALVVTLPGGEPGDAAKAGPARAEFDVVGVDLCVVNSLRRAIMADVPTAAFAFDSSGPSDANGVQFLRNTSALHNEYVGQRVSLVPIGLDENRLRVFDPSHYRFVVKAKNAGAGMLDVTTGDFDVFDQTGARYPKAVRDELFPRCAITGDHILLLRLKPSAAGDGNGEELHAECTATLGTGRQHARWAPVSRCFFRNKIDAAAAEADLERRIADRPPMSDAEAASLRQQHATLDAFRCYLKNEHGEPAAFEFVLESECRLRPAYLVFKGLRVLHDKLVALQAPGKLEFQSYPNMDDFYNIVVHGEDHTLGNLVQGMLYRRWVRDGGMREVSFVGYHQPHPLEPHIVVKLKCAVPGDDAKARFMEGVAWVADQLHQLSLEWVEFAGLGTAGIAEVTDLVARQRQRPSAASKAAAAAKQTAAAPDGDAAAAAAPKAKPKAPKAAKAAKDTAAAT